MNQNQTPETVAEVNQSEAKVHCSDLLAGSPTYPYVVEFGKRMEAKLERNRHKGNREGWINDDAHALLKRLNQEITELAIEMGYAHHEIWESGKCASRAEAVANEAADIANFAMMIADWYKSRAS